MRLTTAMFSCILILLVTMIFQSTDAAKEIFTIRERGANNFGTPIISESDRNQFNGRPNALVERVTLQQDFVYFGSKNATTKIFVHYNGFISVDDSSRFNLGTVGGQIRASKDEQYNFMAIYWQQYEAGEVFQFEYHQTDSQQTANLNGKQLDTIADDLTKAFSRVAKTSLEGRTGNQKTIKERGRVNPREIKDVYVFTWLKMRGVNDRANRQNTFQALLIRVVRGGNKVQWFLKTQLENLGSNGNINNPGDVPPSGSAETNIAQIGIGQHRNNDQTKAKQVVDFEEVFGPRLPTIFELTSNEYKFFDQSSYAFDLNFDATNQPTPPLANCRNGCSKSIEAQIRRNLKFKEQIGENGASGATGERGAPGAGGVTGSKGPSGQIGATGKPGQTRPTTTATTTLAPIDPKELVEDLKRFCRFRNDGEHALPANCDVFIYCSHGIGSFAFCPNGTKFNPAFLTCDHPVNHECRFDTLEELQPLFTQPPSQSNNLCYFDGFGEVSDPMSCEHYYACTNTRSIRMPCPAGLFFKPTSKDSGFCDYPRNVKCSGEGVRPNSSTSVETTPVVKTTTTTPVAETTKYHPRKTNQ